MTTSLQKFSAGDRFISPKKAPEIVGISLSTIKRLLKDPQSDFPKPVEITEGRKAFLLSDLMGWVQRRVESASQRAA